MKVYCIKKLLSYVVSCIFYILAVVIFIFSASTILFTGAFIVRVSYAPVSLMPLQFLFNRVVSSLLPGATSIKIKTFSVQLITFTKKNLTYRYLHFIINDISIAYKKNLFHVDNINFILNGNALLHGLLIPKNIQINTLKAVVTRNLIGQAFLKQISNSYSKKINNALSTDNFSQSKNTFLFSFQRNMKNIRYIYNVNVNDINVRFRGHENLYLTGNFDFNRQNKEFLSSKLYFYFPEVGKHQQHVRPVKLFINAQYPKYPKQDHHSFGLYVSLRNLNLHALPIDIFQGRHTPFLQDMYYLDMLVTASFHAVLLNVDHFIDLVSLSGHLRSYKNGRLLLHYNGKKSPYIINVKKLSADVAVNSSVNSSENFVKINNFVIDSDVLRGVFSARVRHSAYSAKNSSNSKRTVLSLLGHSICLQLPYLAHPLFIKKLNFGNVVMSKNNILIKNGSAVFNNALQSTGYVDADITYTTLTKMLLKLDGMKMHWHVVGNNFPVRLVGDLWPLDAGSSVRKWVVDHIVKGVADKISLSLLFNSHIIQFIQKYKYFPKDAFEISFRFHNATVLYLKGLPSAQDASGGGEFKENVFRADITKAIIYAGARKNKKNLIYLNGVFVVSNRNNNDAEHKNTLGNNILRMNLHVHGTTHSLIDYSQSENFTFSKSIHFFNIKTNKKNTINARNKINLNVKIALPLQSNNEKKILFNINGNLDDLNIGVKYIDKKYNIFHTNGFFHVDGKKFSIKANGVVNDSPVTLVASGNRKPSMSIKYHARIKHTRYSTFLFSPHAQYFDGLTAIDIDGKIDKFGHQGTYAVDLTRASVLMPILSYKKSPGTHLTLNGAFSKDSHGIFLSQIHGMLGEKPFLNGTIFIGKNGAIKAQLRKIQLDNKNDFSLKFTHQIIEKGKNKTFIALNGNAINLAEIFLLADNNKKSSFFSLQNFSVEASFKKIFGKSGTVFYNTDVSFNKQNNKWRKLHITSFQMHNHQKPIRIIYLEKKLGVGIFSAMVDDIGYVFKSIGYSKITGGKVRILGILDFLHNRKAYKFFNGSIMVSNFYVHKYFTLSTLLRLASLRGISSMLNSSGIYFSSAYGIFDIDNANRLHLHSGDIIGPSIGLTVSGQWNIMQRELSFEGVLTPLYAINSFFGRFPIIGYILTGGFNQGVLGVMYRVSGSVEKPRVVINPFSLLAPGFFKNFFQFDNILQDSR